MRGFLTHNSQQSVAVAGCERCWLQYQRSCQVERDHRRRFGFTIASSPSLSTDTQTNMAADHVTCDVYVANMTSLVRQAELVLADSSRRNVTGLSSSPRNLSSSPHRLSSLVNDVFSPALCLFGVVGNALNLVVLTRRRLQHSMDGLERSVRLGLVALAVSDAVFCLLYLLATFLLPAKAKYAPDENRATLFFGIYHEVTTVPI